MSHSVIGASSAHRWLSCPGSVRLSRGVAGRVTEYAARGTVAHEVCERCLKEGGDPAAFLGKVIEADGMEFTVDEAMVESVSVYVNTIRADRKQFGGELLVEQSFNLDWLYPGMYGRNDASLLPELDFDVLRVYDYKNGTKPVNAENNPQGMYYALGALGPGNPLAVSSVEINIIQPNAFGKEPVDRWRISVGDLYRWGNGVLKPGAEATEAPDAPLIEGDWCGFCPAQAICKAKAQAALALFDANPLETMTLPAPDTVPAEQLGKLVAFFGAEAFSDWVKALKAEAQAQLSRNVLIPGLKLVEKTVRGNRRWSDEAGVVKALKSILGDEIFDTKLKSPNQMDKALTGAGLKKDERETLLASLTDRPESVKLEVVSETDLRIGVAEEKKKAIELF